MNGTKEEIEQIAEPVVDAMLGELECPSDQGRHQADGQWVMSRLVDFLGALCVFAVNFSQILREAAVDRDLTPVPWLGNRKMLFACR